MSDDLLAHLGAALPALRTIGFMPFDPIWAEKTHTTAACELLHIVRGTMHLELPGRRYPAGPGDTLFVPTGTPHRDVFTLGSGLELFYCSFIWPAEALYFQHVDNTHLQRLPALRKAELTTLFDQLRADLVGRGPADRLVASARVLAILLLILREALQQAAPAATEPPDSRRRLLLQQAKGYLQRHYAEYVTLDDIARHLHVSAYHLSHVFSEESDFTLFGYLANLRVEKAKALLREGGRTVSEVATAVGFGDANYFAKVFRRQTGMSPSAFARRRP